MPDINHPSRLPLDPYLYNSTQGWWETCGQHLDSDSKSIYGRYQDWMREQGVVIREPNTTEIGIQFTDSESMTLFILRWA